MSVLVELGGGPIGTLDVYAADPRGWDQGEVTALQAHAGVVASLLGAAAKAELKGALADQLQVALESRGLIERAKGALMERERLDDQEAFTHLRRAARSSGFSCRRWPAALDWAAAGPPATGTSSSELEATRTPASRRISIVARGCIAASPESELEGPNRADVK